MFEVQLRRDLGHVERDEIEGCDDALFERFWIETALKFGYLGIEGTDALRETVRSVSSLRGFEVETDATEGASLLKEKSLLRLQSG